MRLEAEVRRDLAAGRLPPVQPFHIMAYPFQRALAKVRSLRPGSMHTLPGYLCGAASVDLTSNSQR